MELDINKHIKEVDKLKALWEIVKRREIKSIQREVSLNSIEKALKTQGLAHRERAEQLNDIEDELDAKRDYLLKEEIRIDTLRSYGKTG